MKIKFSDYIKENVNIENILIYLKYDIRNRFNSVKIKILDGTIKQELKPKIISEFDTIIYLYDDESSRGYNYLDFQLKTQKEYYYMLFYYCYLLNFKYNNSSLSNAYVINIQDLTDVENINLIKTFFDYLQKNKISIMIEEYMNRINKIDDIIINCLDDEQKIKYQHLLNAKNFDLI